MRPPLEVQPVGAVADEAERRLDAAFAQQLEAFEDVVAALHGGHAADPADGEPAVRDPEVAAGLRAAVRRPDALVELDPEPHDGELLRRRDAEPDEVVPYLRAHGDEHRRVAREDPLEPAEEPRAERPEVAAQDVAVEGVDDDRRPRAPRQQRSHPPDRAGLRGVRVQDRWSLAPDQRRESERREHVAKRGDLAPELRDRHDPDVEPVGDERHRVLAAGERAGDEGRVVAALAQARRQVRDVQCRTAHVQARDHAHDLHAVCVRQRGRGTCPRRSGALPRDRCAAASRAAPAPA